MKTTRDMRMVVTAVTAVTVLALALSANAGIVIVNQLEGFGGSDKTKVATVHNGTTEVTYDATGVDKLVFVFGTESGFNNQKVNSVGVSFNGVPLTLAVQDNYAPPGIAPYTNDGGYAGIFYLDNPFQGAATFTLSTTTTSGTPNGSHVSILGLAGTAPGVGSTASRWTSQAAAGNVSTSLSTSVGNALVIAGVENSGSNNAAGTPNVVAPLTLSNNGSWGSNWGGAASGYQAVPTSGTTVTPTFSTNAGGSIHVVAAEFMGAPANLYWSGAGTWDNSTQNWGSVSGGPYNAAIWNSGAPDNAIFEGSANAAYTVTVNGTIQIRNLTFNTTGTAGPRYTIDGGTLAFAPGGTISNTDNRYNQTITSAITGSPTVSLKDYGAGNMYNGLVFAPTSGTQTLGAVLNPNNTATGTGSTDKSGITLGGTTTGNSVASISYAGGDRYADVNKTGSGTWSVGNINTGTIKVSDGTLILSGTAGCYYNEMRVTGGRVTGAFTIFTNDRRGAPYFNSGGTLAPGNGVGTVTLDWGTTGTPAAGSGDYSLVFNNGSIYEWQVGSAATDTVHLTEGRLYVNDMTLKILDAGGTPSATDHLPVFTYAAGVTRDLSGFLNRFDTSTLGSMWRTTGLSLVDDGQGTIYLTGLAVVQDGTLRIVKFLDLNGDGVMDGNETFLSAGMFQFEVFDAGGTLVGTFPNSQDIALPEGLYTGRELLSGDWSATTANPFQFAITAGELTEVLVGNTVPEPATMALLGLAAAGLGRYVRRRRA